MLFVFICIGNIAHKSVLNVNVNGFYNVLGYSLPECEFQLICCSSFILLEVSPFLGITLVLQYFSQSLLFNETIDKFLGPFLTCF